jgi:hypothetical protein
MNVIAGYSAMQETGISLHLGHGICVCMEDALKFIV